MTNDANTVQKIEEILSYASMGSEQRFRHFTGMVYSENVQRVADAAGAHWLIDLIGSYQGTRKLAPSQDWQAWRLEVFADKSAMAICEDGNGTVIVKQRIPYTDFPILDKPIRVWVIDGVAILPEEY